MPRMILRIMTATAVVCMVCLNPTQTSAKNLDNGPHHETAILEADESISLTCPAPITVDCDDNGIYQTYQEFVNAGGSANLPDDCEVTSFSHVEDTEISQNGCTFVFMREYVIEASCDNTFTCNQIVMLTDNDNPTIIACAANITLPMDNSGGTCLVAYSVPDITVTDGCDPNVMVSNDSPGNFPVGPTTVTYTATDNCGNSAQCSFVVTITDSTPLTVSCPLDIDVDDVCDIAEVPQYADVNAFTLAGGTVSGNCSSMSGGTFIFTNVTTEPSMGTCPQVFNRTYTISDGSTTGSCTQTITIRDEEVPTFVVPADITVDCGLTQDTSVTGAPTIVMDNCDENPTVTWDDGTQVPLTTTCTGEYTFIREWIVTDNCLNADTLEQIITTLDTVAPIAICKDTFVVYLDELGSAVLVADSLDNGSTDNCSEVIFSTNMSFVACNQLAGNIPATLTVSDECGNMSSCDLIIKLLDTMSITLISPPNDTVMCIEDIPAQYADYQEYFLDGGLAMNNCFVNDILVLVSADTIGVCPIEVVRIYEYTDASGNSDTSTHTILVIDEEAPVITSVCDDIVITEMNYCDTLLTLIPPTFTDNCNNVVITNSYTGDASLSAVFEGGNYDISFYTTDACGNADTCTINIDIAADPRVTFPPLGEINSMADLPDYADLDAFLAAGGTLNMFCLIDTLVDYDPDFDIQPDGCSAIITETATFQDTSGMTITATNIIVAMDTLDPVITGCFTQFTMLRHADCMFDTAFISPVATDNFGIDTSYYTISTFVNDTATVTFTAQDLCGRTSNCEFDLIVFDPTSPDISIDDITIMCDTMNAAPAYTTVQEFLAGPNAMIYDCRLDFNFLGMVETMDIDGNLVRTYTVRDLSGNDASEDQVIFVMDETAPIITVCPNDTIVEIIDNTACGIFINLPDLQYTDNCGGPGTVTVTHDSPFGNATDCADGTYPVGMTEVSYYITDENGLMDTCTFTVSIEDNLPPSVVCPLDMDIDCSISNFNATTDSTSFTAMGGTITDGCGIMSVTSTVANPSPNNYVVTYTITDVNGNENTCDQTLTIVDSEDPVLTCVPMIIVPTPQNSCDSIMTITPPTATDNCGVESIYNNINQMGTLTMSFTGTTEIKWYAVDAFGNMDSCTYQIMVIDGTGPVLSEPDIVRVMCTDMAEEVDSFMTIQDLVDAGGSAFDNCGIETFQIYDETEIGDSIIRRHYEAIDTTGNRSTVIQTIIIDDTTPPTLVGPKDIVIDCSIALDSLEILGTVDTMSLDDNCMETDTLIYLDNVFSTGSCLANDSIQRIWILTDDSGNESRDTQIITRIDTTGPVFDMALSTIADIMCGDKLPLTQTLTATDDCSGAIVTVDTIPPVAPPNFCSDYEIKYRYTATDNCGNTTQDSVSFMRLADTTAPILVDNNNQVLNSIPGKCGFLFDDLTRPSFTDDCSSFTLSDNFIGDTIRLDTTLIIWTATNSCGLSSQTTQVVVVNDNEPPVIVCQDLNVSLGGDGIAIVQADTLAKTITDNCAHYFGNKVTVRRLDNGTACTNDGMFNKSVIFCCEDIGNTIEVEVQVHDGNGNYNSCTSEITINNAQLQTNIPQLNDVTISCEFTYDPDDLSIFGSYVDNPADITDTIIEGQFIEDAAYINTCDMTTVTETSTFSTGGCGNDTLTRFFKFSNGVDSFTLPQKIIRFDINPFTGNDIEWPAHFVWNQCMNPAPDTSISGAPILMNNDFCSQVAVTYKDQLFNFPATSCPTVKRKWKVIDWCQYDNSNGDANNPGLWEYEQFINVENDVPPTILSACNDTLICAPGNSCDATVSLDITAEDDCNVGGQNLLYSYRIDIGNDNNNANDITGTTSSFTHDVVPGIHKVKWSVNDRCGNTNNSCEFLITVKECKDPTPICHDGIALDLSGNQSVELWASDLNQNSFDNCTQNLDLKISFSSDPTVNLKSFTCDDIGPNEVDMWVTDLAGNQSFCTAIVTIQDNLGGCTTPMAPNVQGKIITENNVAIPEAMVSIIGAELDDEIMTEENGLYTFQDLDTENDYQIQVDRDKEYLDGVSTLDLVLIQRHILGLEELDSPYKLIAADINNSESITAADLLALRKLILGVDLSLEDNTSWRFISKNATMNDMTDPWPFTEELTLQLVNTTPIDADFVGVKIGDVNNSAEGLLTYETIEKRSDNSLGIQTKDMVIRRDDQVYIDLVNSTDVELEALQMTITWDAKVMTLIDIVPIGIELQKYHTSVIAPGQITVAWHNIKGKKVVEGVPFFQLVMEGNETANLSDILEINSNITEAIAYNSMDESMDISLRFTQSQSIGIEFGQNKPNPFLSETTVEFSLPESMEVTFKVFDGSGKLIHKTSNNYSEGANILKLGEQLGDYKGILFLKMEAAEFSEVKRMIRIE